MFVCAICHLSIIYLTGLCLACFTLQLKQLSIWFAFIKVNVTSRHSRAITFYVGLTAPQWLLHPTLTTLSSLTLLSSYSPALYSTLFKDECQFCFCGVQQHGWEGKGEESVMDYSEAATLDEWNTSFSVHDSASDLSGWFPNIMK